ncbi:MAG TPA: exodeoxyribonuclease VII large subunit, partial [Xanthomonadaceae bacterium]|nr:exodeoxyribonuclease VII large subunit [Xanthomonadaceae bacterium]
ALRRAFEELKAKLAGEGLFDAARKQPLPAFPRRVGVITSPGGAAVRDILSVLARRFRMLEVDVLPVPVQGATAAAQIAAMLRRADRSGRYDVLLLARGGGSLEDLLAFNDEALTRAIAACVTPVVSAVGHETDFSLTDFAADLRAPTPSAAAELLTPEQGDLTRRVDALHRVLGERVQRQLRGAAQHSDRCALRLQALRPQARLGLLRRRQLEAWRRLHAACAVLARARSVRVGRAQAALAVAHPHRRLGLLQARLDRTAPRARAALVQQLQASTLRLRGLVRALDAVSPLSTVARGYAVLRRADDGRLVRSVVQASVGDRLLARLSDGELRLRVEDDRDPQDVLF